MEQEHRITYKAGITRTPSDFLCQDGELAECINLVTDNEELKPVVQPAPFITEALDQDGQTEIDIPDILYIHKFNDQERYIYKRYGMIGSQPVEFMAWGTVSRTTLTQIRPLEIDSGVVLLYDSSMKITSVGKTLIITKDNERIHYFIYKPNEYDHYYDIPAPDVSFKLTDHRGGSLQSLIFETKGTWGDARGDTREHGVAVGKQEEFNDIIVGVYQRNIKTAQRAKAFTRPFLVRFALEMYDGSFHHISQPIVMLPSVTRNSWINMISDEEFVMRTKGCLLWYKSHKNLKEFSDVVKNISVFVSKEIEINDTISDQYLDNFANNVQYDTISEALDALVADQSTYRVSHVEPDIQHPERTPWRAVIERDTHHVMEDLVSTSLFYKLAEINLTDTSEYKQFDFDEHKLENITTAQRIEEDDFYSNCFMYPEFVYSYNSRLNLANVARGFFKGFGFFMPYDNATENDYTAYVKIATDSGDYWIENQYRTKQKQGIYFYYPDSRASHVTIFKGNYCICDADLQEHSGLNGAYYINKDPITMVGHHQPTFVDEETVSSTTPDFHPNDHHNNNDDTELLSNYIIQSEINNPWVFKARGYFKVGTGKIIGMSTTTQALSQGQFGQYPLLVFSESGIWALSVGTEGYYTSIYPMSRDVCINPGSILQTDGSVFFVSKKGLMAVAGNEVVCVSERMNGAAFNTAMLSPLATDTDWEDIVEACQGSNSFLDYIRDTSMFMAYDYIDSRIVMMNPHYDYSFVYNIPDGTISKVILPADMTNAVNNYPDYLIQGRKPNDQVWVYSFYEKPREEEVNSRSLAFLLTRPMKLSGPVSQASLRQLKNVGTWIRKDMQGNPLSCVKTEVYLSEDMQRWYADISRHGAAARYYRLALYIKMLPTERLSGTILTEQERRSNHIR